MSGSVLLRPGCERRDCAINVWYGISGFWSVLSVSGGGVGVVIDGVVSSSEDSLSSRDAS